MFLIHEDDLYIYPILWRFGLIRVLKRKKKHYVGKLDKILLIMKYIRINSSAWMLIDFEAALVIKRSRIQR